VETTVEMSFTLSGDPSDYGTEQEDAIKTVLAEEAGVSTSAVTLSITAGSVIVTAEISLPSFHGAATAAAALSTGVLASAKALETALVTQFVEDGLAVDNLSVASVEAPKIVGAEGSDSDGLGTGALVGIIIGGLAGGGILLAVAVVMRKRKSGRVVARVSNQ